MPRELLDPDRIGREAQRLEADLRRRIVGQEDAIQQVVSGYQTYLAGLASPGRPIATYLFLGPTGSGKTRLVESVAESLLGQAEGVVKIDCAEYQHSHEIAKLIGSPPGYLGHRETQPALSQEVLDQYRTERADFSLVLFDEIEKANDALWNLLLGILDKATLTLGDNRRVDFSKALIFMTSNLGAAEMSSILSPRIGFAMIPRVASGDGSLDETTAAGIVRAGVNAARRRFTPEFINRIDKIIVFNALGPAQLRDILTIELDRIQERVLAAARCKPFGIAVTKAAREYLLQQGTDARYGARSLKRTIEHLVVHPLSNLIATRQVRRSNIIRVDFDETAERLTFYREAARGEQLLARRPAPRPRPIVMRARSMDARGSAVFSSLPEKPRKH